MIIKWRVSITLLRIGILYLGYAWLFAFSLFETRLIYKGYTLQQRITFLQRRWLYFLGYGTVWSLLYLFGNYSVMYSLYHNLTNIMILNTIHLTPKKFDLLVSMPIFGVVRQLSDWIVSALPTQKSLKKKENLKLT